MNTLFYRSLVLHVKCSFCKIFKSERVLDPQIISHVLTPVFHLHHVSHICLHLFFLLSVFIATFSHWLRLIMEALLSAYTYMWSVWKHGKLWFWAPNMENIWFWEPKYIKYEIQLLIGKIIFKTCIMSYLLFFFPNCP